MKNKKYLQRKAAEPYEDILTEEDPIDRPLMVGEEPVQLITDLEEEMAEKGKSQEEWQKDPRHPYTQLLQTPGETEEQISERIEDKAQDMLNQVKRGVLPADLVEWEAFLFDQDVSEKSKGIIDQSPIMKGMSQKARSDYVMESFSDYIYGDDYGLKQLGLSHLAESFHRDFVDNLEEKLTAGRSKYMDIGKNLPENK